MKLQSSNSSISVSDVVKPHFDELTITAASAVNEAFEHDEDRDLDSVIDIEPPSYLIERRRLSTIDENLDSPNLTLASVKNADQKVHVRTIFEESEEDLYKDQEKVINPKPEISSSEEEVSKYTAPIFV